MQRVGTRCQVMHGNAKMTGGGLRKKDLKYNKQGKIVSKKVSARAKREKRLQKAGWVTTKGQFGAFQIKGGASTNEPNPDTREGMKKLVGDEISNVDFNKFLNQEFVLSKEVGSIKVFDIIKRVINYFFEYCFPDVNSSNNEDSSNNKDQISLIKKTNIKALENTIDVLIQQLASVNISQNFLNYLRTLKLQMLNCPLLLRQVIIDLYKSIKVKNSPLISGWIICMKNNFI